MCFFDKNPVGRILNRFSQDVGSIDKLIPYTQDDLLYCGLEVLSTIIIVAFSTPLFITTFIPLIILYVFLQVLTM